MNGAKKGFNEGVFAARQFGGETFLLSYIACALWISNDESSPDGGEALDRNYDRDDLADEAKVKMEADCKAFMDANEALLVDYPAGQAGHDFWLSRNGHGSGFSDNDYGTEEQCDALQEAAKAFGECYLYVGDDGKIYLS